MNRDELRTRAAALPPELETAGPVQLLYPKEPGGGTWIGANSFGNSLALMNANPIAAAAGLPPKQKSRGDIIPALLRARTLQEIENPAQAFSFTGMHPFRLFGFFPQERRVGNWYWDGLTLNVVQQDWVRGHWFSSSISDKRASRERSKAFAGIAQDNLGDPGSWLRSVHASHAPRKGAFSVCVHREDAATVSYTEIHVGTARLLMNYWAGNPCESRGLPVPQTIALRTGL